MFQDLIDRKLVKGNTVGDLTIFKYTKRVFFENLWNEDSRLLDARGMVLDSEGNKVIWPFTKVFNYGENGTTVPRDQKVKWVRKVNGFMAAARWCKDNLLVSSTGSLNSDYVQLAHQVITKDIGHHCALWASLHEYTLLFEICDPSDPHIVTEEAGAYLIGMREMKTGRMMSEQFCDWVAVKAGWLRPTHGEAQFDDVVKWSKLCEHEGFMIRSLETGELLLKLKSVHYLTKKFLMRSSEKKMTLLWENKIDFMASIDEEFYNVCESIINTFKSPNQWCEIGENARRIFIEKFFNDAT